MPPTFRSAGGRHPDLSTCSCGLLQGTGPAVGAGPSPLIWQSRTPVSPIAQLTDSLSLALLQDWVVIFAVGFGIAGSMLASLLFEWLRPRPQQAAADSRSQPQSTTVPVVGQAQSAAAAGTPWRWLAPIGAVIVISYPRSRLTRRRDN